MVGKACRKEEGTPNSVGRSDQPGRVLSKCRPEIMLMVAGTDRPKPITTSENARRSIVAIILHVDRSGLARMRFQSCATYNIKVGVS
jgi:hypothetical protein